MARFFLVAEKLGRTHWVQNFAKCRCLKIYNHIWFCCSGSLVSYGYGYKTRKLISRLKVISQKPPIVQSCSEEMWLFYSGF